MINNLLLINYLEYLFKLINSAHKIELDLRENERIYCCQAVGTARFAYNWALVKWQEQYQEFKEIKSLTKLRFVRILMP